MTVPESIRNYFCNAPGSREWILNLPAKYSGKDWALLKIRIRCMRFFLPVMLKIRSLNALVNNPRPHKNLSGNYRDLFPLSIVYIDNLLKISGNPEHKKCLLRSLLFYYAFSYLGLHPKLNIGLIDREKNMGHAWITIDDFIICDNQIDTYRDLLHDAGNIAYWLPDDFS